MAGISVRSPSLMGLRVSARKVIVSEAILTSQVLVVDDEPANVALLERLLAKAGFTQIVSTTKPRDGLSMIRSNEPDIVLLDLMMPEIDGFAFMKEVRSEGERYQSLPILVLTADPSAETKKRALAVGANDFLTKPFDPVEVVLRTNNLLKTRHLNRDLESANNQLEDLVGLRTTEVDVTRVQVLDKLALAAEYRDDKTKEHTRRVGQYSAILAATSGIAAQEVDYIRKGAPLHDLGKIGIPESILLKESKLSDEEMKIVERHSLIGYEMLKETSDPILELAAVISLNHHERFDGQGYPNGLGGNSIPKVARIVAITDSFDSMLHDRPWRKALDLDQVVEEMKAESGTKFDPELLATFCDLLDKGRISIH